MRPFDALPATQAPSMTGRAVPEDRTSGVMRMQSLRSCDQPTGRRHGLSPPAARNDDGAEDRRFPPAQHHIHRIVLAARVPAVLAVPMQSRASSGQRASSGCDAPLWTRTFCRLPPRQERLTPRRSEQDVVSRCAFEPSPSPLIAVRGTANRSGCWTSRPDLDRERRWIRCRGTATPSTRCHFASSDHRLVTLVGRWHRAQDLARMQP